LKQTIDLIMRCARIPSFSSHEERLHPLIEEIVAEISFARLEKTPGNNLVAFVPGKRKTRPVAIAAHLDKINHFGRDSTEMLPVKNDGEWLAGQLDDATGVGICLSLLLKSASCDFPPLYAFFSEMEESFGLRNHPHLLKDEGKGLYPRIGAQRISEYIIANHNPPGVIATIDTTPFFKGERGVALYSEHWEISGFTPSAGLVALTGKLRNYFLKIDPEIKLINNINDYVKYGEIFNRHSEKPVASLAIEPAIFPYHQQGEKVFLSDIEKVLEIMVNFLENFDTESQNI
jgi:hypothetical protein